MDRQERGLRVFRTPSKEHVFHRFDKAAADWDANIARVDLANGVAEAIRQTVPLRPDMQAMDFGAGTGLLTLALLPHLGAFTAVDSSSMMLRVLDGKLANLKIANVNTLHCDITEAALPATAFDLIVSSMALHHMRDVLTVLARLRPCLKPGGWIAVADLDSEDGTFHADPTGVYHRGFDRQDVCKWLEQAGFVDTSARNAYRIVRPAADGTTREYGVFLAAGKVL